jgi:hypothetical protein
MRWPRRKPKLIPLPPEPTVLEWLTKQYVHGTMTLEMYEYRVNQLRHVLDSPMSVIKYMQLS